MKFITFIFNLLLVNSIFTVAINKKGPADLNKVKVLNVKVEEADRAPAHLKRYNAEMRMERERLRDFENRETMLKGQYMKVIETQNEQLDILTKISQENMKILFKLEEFNPDNEVPINKILHEASKMQLAS